LQSSILNTLPQPSGEQNSFVRRLRIDAALSLLYGIYGWLVFGALLLVFFLLATPLRHPAWARRLARVIARTMFGLMGMPLSAHGLQQLPAQPHVLLINHSSFLDAIALIALLPANPGYSLAARQEFPAQRLLCPLLNSVHTLVLQPPGARRGINIALMKEALERGENLAVFPEGRFTRAPGLRAFHSGVFLAATLARVPVAVAGLHGTRAALPLGTWLVRRAAVELKVGSVFAPGTSDAPSRRRLCAKARAAMLRLCGEGEAQ
jgi:1-acyl-sn-glycerol-3-phosphate acyltransferase